MSDLLEFVRSELASSRGELPRVSRHTKIPYDTILRIKNGEGDPGYSKVQRLADYFRRLREFEESI
jgi:predicted transcriptional regulator